MYRLLRPLLFTLQPEAAHHLTFRVLKLMHRLTLLPQKSFYQPVTICGIHFPNPVGLAAGLDKNAEYIDILARLGFGFIEVGTVTPKPQTGNPQPRLFRLPKAQALINRFGFNSCGLTQFIRNIQSSQFKGVLGINIGKNKITPNDKAWDDYQQGLQAVYPYATYITINISSPNTPGLRELQSEVYLDALLANIRQEQAKLAKQYDKYVPIFIKIAPDLDNDASHAMAKVLLKHHVDGVIIGNTSDSRAGVAHLPHGTERGGLSGQPIAALNTQCIKQFSQQLAGKIPIIGLGGVMDVKTAQDKLDAGASLIQIYTGLIYLGPKLIEKICRSL